MNPRMEGERPSLAELVEFCEGDEGAAVWLAQKWGRLHPTDLCNDTAYALTYYRSMQANFERLREAFHGERKEALFDAIEWAANMGIPIPEWARAPFSEGWLRYRDVVPDDASAPPSKWKSTLGGAFGISRPDGFNAPAARFWGGHAYYVWRLVRDRHKAGEKLTAAFAAVAEDLTEAGPNLRAYAIRWGLPAEAADELVDARTRKGISAATVSNCYYAIENHEKEHAAQREKQERKRTRPAFPNLSPGRKR